MTAQSMENIYIDGKPYYMASEPLEQYLSLTEGVPTFNAPNTACWRGYYGNWKITDNKLYLTGLTGFIQTPEDEYRFCRILSRIGLFQSKSTLSKIIKR